MSDFKYIRTLHSERFRKILTRLYSICDTSHDLAGFFFSHGVIGAAYAKVLAGLAAPPAVGR